MQPGIIVGEKGKNSTARVLLLLLFPPLPHHCHSRSDTEFWCRYLQKEVPTREIVELWVIKLAKIVILEKNVMTKHPQKPLVIPKNTNEKVICFRHITVSKENPKSSKKEAKAYYF